MKAKLKLTEENVIAIHEIGHFLFFLVGAIINSNSIGDYRKLIGRVTSINVLTIGDVHGSVDIDLIENLGFKDLIYMSGCLSAYYYYNKELIGVDAFKDLFYKTGGSNDYDIALEDVKDEAKLYELGKEIWTIMRSGRFRYLLESWSIKLEDKKEFKKSECFRISMSLYNTLKSIIEENKKIGN